MKLFPYKIDALLWYSLAWV